MHLRLRQQSPAPLRLAAAAAAAATAAAAAATTTTTIAAAAAAAVAARWRASVDIPSETQGQCETLESGEVPEPQGGPFPPDHHIDQNPFRLIITQLSRRVGLGSPCPLLPEACAL
jgi:hypothetical protein